MTLALETRGLVKRFGGITATDHVSLRIEQGARQALIGPNGAGKTTLVNVLTGVLQPSAGSVYLNGADITNASSERRVRLGLARTFQINQLFPSLSVMQTLALAIHERQGNGYRFWPNGTDDRAVAVEAAEVAARLGLSDVAGETVAVLPYGKQRQLEIALAIACKPKVLLLDEPAAGVPEAERQELLSAIAALPDAVTVVLIEHDMDIVFRFAKRISVLVNGTVFAEGSREEMARDPRVKAVYLGEADHA
ncbi:MAG: ABC transporter ATP-binding protein [Beijerinckiaceae bacterium]